MHKSSYDEMARIIAERIGPILRVADFGAQDVNGSYRPLFPASEYIGIDMAPGKNVDVVMKSEFDTGLPAESFHFVISGQCLEHCSNPFKLVEEMYRVCAVGGTCVIIAPFIWKEHRYPIDCWRFLPDGMDCLFKNAGFTFVKSYIKGTDCIGIARRAR